MNRRREAGFTLLELLVALVVLGMLMGILTQAVDVSLRSWRLQSGTIARRSDLESVDRALRHLIEHMDPGTFATQATVDGQAHAMSFTTDLPMAAEALRTRTADVALGVDAQHRLLLHWTLHFPGQQADMRRENTTELLSGVERIDIAYRQEGGDAWLAEWHAPGNPALVRIRVVFPAGDRRRWPDLVAAPKRGRPVVQAAPNRRDQPV
jgi:general secretion pathway protein J